MFGDILKELRTSVKLTQINLAEKTGLSKSAISMYENNNREPDFETLEAFADFFNVDMNYLLGKTPTKIESNATILPSENIFNIPLFESVSAGFGATACEDVIDYIPIYLRNPYEADITMGIIVRGDSMYPKIEDGDTIVVRKQDSVDSGAIAVVMVDEEDALVKKVDYGDDWIDLVSINPEYKTKHFKGENVMRIRILGIVKQIIKDL